MANHTTGETTRVTGSYGFTGPAEVVFGVLTDPDRAARWLPPDVGAESVTLRRVEVRGAEQAHGYDVEIIPESLRVRWGSAEAGNAYGAVHVEDAPAGGSVVHAEVTVADGGDEETMTKLLEEAVRNLQRDVSDNFNAG